MNSQAVVIDASEVMLMRVNRSYLSPAVVLECSSVPWQSTPSLSAAVQCRRVPGSHLTKLNLETRQGYLWLRPCRSVPTQKAWLPKKRHRHHVGQNFAEGVDHLASRKVGTAASAVPALQCLANAASFGTIKSAGVCFLANHLPLCRRAATTHLGGYMRCPKRAICSIATSKQS